MSISAYREITDWSDCEYTVSNHVYLFDGKSNILAYEIAGTNEIVIFKKPMKISTTRRKFEKINHKALDAFGKTIVLKPESKVDGVNSFEVKSDSGKTYIVTLISGKYQCNCVGYAYRGNCRHSKEIADANKSVDS